MPKAVELIQSKQPVSHTVSQSPKNRTSTRRVGKALQIEIKGFFFFSVFLVFNQMVLLILFQNLHGMVKKFFFFVSGAF
jgi:hypothetical protein